MMTVEFAIWLLWPVGVLCLSLWLNERRLNKIEQFMCDDCYEQYCQMLDLEVQLKGRL